MHGTNIMHQSKEYWTLIADLRLIKSRIAAQSKIEGVFVEGMPEKRSGSRTCNDFTHATNAPQHPQSMRSQGTRTA